MKAVTEHNIQEFRDDMTEFENHAFRMQRILTKWEVENRNKREIKKHFDIKKIITNIRKWVENEEELN